MIYEIVKEYNMNTGTIIMAIIGTIILFGGTFFGLAKMKPPKS